MTLCVNYPKWQGVLDTFIENHSEGDDGASLALVIDGKLVLNVAAGVGQNRLLDKKNIPWSEDTLVNVFSAGKGLVAICILQLVQQGKLILDKPIADYWPEFAQFKKGEITVKQVLTHRSGLSAFHHTIPQDQIYNWQSMADAITQDEPWWEPGTAQGYSPFIYGWILGELVRRVVGVQSFNDYFQQAVAQPLNLDCFFGVPEKKLSQIVDTFPLKQIVKNHTSIKQIADKEMSQVSPTISEADSAALGRIMKADPRGITNRAFSNPISLMTSSNSLAWREAQIPAANAHINASALAKFYGDLVSGSSKLLSEDFLPLCWQEQTFEMDKVLGLPLRFSCGFMLSQSQRSDCRYGKGDRSFGHPGAGGSLGFADPDYRLGFGYVTQRMGQKILIDDRVVKLIDAVYKVLEA